VCILILNSIGLGTPPEISNFGNVISFTIGSVLRLDSPAEDEVGGGIVLDESGRERNACGGGVGGGFCSLDNVLELFLLFDLTDDLSEWILSLRLSLLWLDSIL